MSDNETLTAYDASAESYATEWEDKQNPPVDMQELLNTFFVPGTVFDIGCGSGRDAAWLTSAGFSVTGFDASTGLIAEARRRHPEVSFSRAVLPELPELSGAHADNVLCETVIMHLPEEQIAGAVRRLYDLVAPAGTLYLSWRVTPDAPTRDAAGRLYSSFSADLVRHELADAQTVHDEATTSASSGRTVHRLIVRRPSGKPDTSIKD